MIIEIEDQLVAILRNRFEGSGVLVQPVADDPTNLDVLGANGSIFVRYIGEQTIPNVGSTGYMMKWRFACIVGSRHFGRTKPDAGVYTMLDGIRATLRGRTLIVDEGERRHKIRLIPEGGNFINEHKQIWWYQLTFVGNDSILIA